MKKYTKRVLIGLLLGLAFNANALLINPANSNHAINDSAFIDGTVADAQSSFNSAITSQTLTGTFSFSNIPVTTISMMDFFVFSYDSQETGGNPAISIDDIQISVAGLGVLWDYDEVTFGSIDLAGDTDSPLGNGADIALAIPVSIFQGLGLTGADDLTFTWTQSNDNNGFDEWVLAGTGAFDPGDPIGPVPIPAAVWLFGSALMGLVGIRRRRKN